jgi:hypothetical protein
MADARVDAVDAGDVAIASVLAPEVAVAGAALT